MRINLCLLSCNLKKTWDSLQSKKLIIGFVRKIIELTLCNILKHTIFTRASQTCKCCKQCVQMVVTNRADRLPGRDRAQAALHSSARVHSRLYSGSTSLLGHLSLTHLNHKYEITLDVLSKCRQQMLSSLSFPGSSMCSHLSSQFLRPL